MKVVDNLIEEQFATTLDEHGVTRTQWQLMNVMARQPSSVEQLTAAVAPFLNGDEGESAQDHLSELAESEWVVLGATCELTERGRGALDRLTGVVTVQRTTMSEGLTAEQYETAVAVLERMARNLGWSDPAETVSG